ncbi:leucine-rich repeat domain-containing protein [Amycolatopsis sp. NPDC004169]|uniref:leucine-rich repeat domain-containing protein n=1 Tax=Amycolatopsis sp. NPDC004169 TaxID=3154453 RepID=UPI0033B0D0CF
MRVRTVNGAKELQVDSGPWTRSLSDRFTAEGCTSLLVGSPRGPVLPDLGFVRDLPGLTRIRLLRGVADCSAVAGVPGLTELTLASDYRGPLSLAGLTRLEVLGMPFLPAVADLTPLRALRELTVWGWPRTEPSLRLLGDKPALEFLRLELIRTTVLTPAGLAAPNLRTLWLYDGRVSFDGTFPELTVLRLHSTKTASLDFVRDLPRLRELFLENAGEVESVTPVRGHPALRTVAFGGRTTFRDGDLSALLDLPEVALERGAPHYSHRPAEVRKGP